MPAVRGSPCFCAVGLTPHRKSYRSYQVSVNQKPPPCALCPGACHYRVKTRLSLCGRGCGYSNGTAAVLRPVKGLRGWVHGSFGEASFRPGGAPDCSHGWSPAQPDATRGFQREEMEPRRGGGSVLDRASAAPPGREARRVSFHGLRFACLAAGCAPPVATFLCPYRGKMTRPKMPKPVTSSTMAGKRYTGCPSR